MRMTLTLLLAGFALMTIVPMASAEPVFGGPPSIHCFLQNGVYCINLFCPYDPMSGDTAVAVDYGTEIGVGYDSSGPLIGYREGYAGIFVMEGGKCPPEP